MHIEPDTPLTYIVYTQALRTKPIAVTYLNNRHATVKQMYTSNKLHFF